MSSLLGRTVASFEAVPNGRLHYRQIKFDKISALKQNKTYFQAKSYLSPTAITELKWQNDNILRFYRQFKSIPEVNYTIYSDANTKDWSAHEKNHTKNGR